jgi:hypothetical protein
MLGSTSMQASSLSYPPRACSSGKVMRSPICRSRSFAASLLGQCNAYDAYKRLIVEADDVAGYFAEARSIVARGILPQADVI